MYKKERWRKEQVKDFFKLLVVDIGMSVRTTVVETQSACKRPKKKGATSNNKVYSDIVHIYI